MANLSELRSEWGRYSGEEQGKWLYSQMKEVFSVVSTRLNGANVVLYFSACLQRQEDLGTGMKMEDVNGWMNAFYKMDFKKELVVIMHTSGGDLDSVELISEYIHSKFKKVTVVVPVMAMSAGTMFCLSCDKIIISRAGQLGPIDPHVRTLQGAFSVKEIIAQFHNVRSDILKNERAEHAWTPILQSYGPALYERASGMECHFKGKIKEWLQKKGKTLEEAEKIVKFFHDLPDYHGQRISYESICDQGLNGQLLEADQKLQDAVMMIYHLATICTENSPILRSIISDKMQEWTKNAPTSN